MKRHLIHTILCFLLITLVFNGVWWLAAPLTLWYALQYPSYELIMAAFCIDVYFAPTFYMWDYTIVAVLLVVVGIFIRPRLRLKHSLMSSVS